MAIIQKIMGAMGIKSASKTVKTAKSLATAVAQPNVTSKAIDKKMSADAAQGMAMVNMSGKKAYVKPESRVIEMPKKSKLTAASGEGGSTPDDPFAGMEDPTPTTSCSKSTSSMWDE